MKKLKLLSTLFTFLLLGVGCSNESNPEVSIDISEVSFKLNDLQELLDLENVTKGEDIELNVNPDFRDKMSNRTLRRYTESFLTTSNLNHLIDWTSNGSLNVKGIITFTNDNSPQGVGLYFLDSEQKLYIALFEEIGEFYEVRNGFPKIVNDITFDDVNYLGYEHYGDSNINVVLALEYDPRNNKSPYNDLYLERALKRFKRKKAEIIKANNKQSSITNTGDEHISGPQNGCAMISRCLDGDGTQICNNYGCVDPPCGFNQASVEYDTNLSLRNYKDSFHNNIYHSLVDAVESKFSNTELGLEYINLYYSMSQHFDYTFSQDLMVKIAQTAPELGIALSNYLYGNSSDVLINDTLRNNLFEIFQLSRDNSSSTSYLDALNTLETEVQEYVNKPKSQVEYQMANGNYIAPAE